MANRMSRLLPILSSVLSTLCVIGLVLLFTVFQGNRAFALALAVLAVVTLVLIFFTYRQFKKED